MATQSAELQLRADEPATVGHFPGNPIVPGAVLLREVMRIVVPDCAGHGCEISAARFYLPVRPGDRLTVRWDTQAAGDISFTCSTGAGSTDVSSTGTCSTDAPSTDVRSTDVRSTGVGSTGAGAGERRVLSGTFRLRTR